MQRLYMLSLVAAGIILCGSQAVAQEPIRWQPTLENAKQLAAQSDRLVLIHFWADWCQPCQKVEQEVFSQPGVAAAIQTHYVPVKVNADYFPHTRKQYGVTALPADVIITPQGQQIEKFQGFTPAAQYAAQLDQVAVAVKAQARAMVAQMPAGGTPQQALPPIAATPSLPVGPTGPAFQPAAVGQPVAQQAPLLVPGNPAFASQGPLQPAGAQPPPIQPVQPPSPPATAPNPPLGLDGYCPVQLTEDMVNSRPKWTLGDRRWGAIHRGRTYLFAGPQQQHRFFGDPDRYAPVLSGSDVVVAIDQGQMVPGRREHGVVFGNRIYLFANEQSLQRFSQKPDQYANLALQRMQQSAAAPPLGTAAQSAGQRY